MQAETVNHQCMIYSGSPAEHLPGLAAVMKQRLQENWRCLYLNSPTWVPELRKCLEQTGVAVDQEVEREALLLSSSQDHLKNGDFDVAGMLLMLSKAVDDSLKEGYKGLWASGDMSWEFGDEKNFAKLREYEYALERMFQRQPAFSGVCQYHADTLPSDVVQWGLYTHRSVYINEAVSRTNPHYDPIGLLTYRYPVASAVELHEILAQPARD